MGSDAISFGTDGWRAPLEEFTRPRVRMVAQGIAQYLQETDAKRPIAVGYDARESSRAFAEDVSTVLCANGIDVLLSERDRPTPLFAYAIVDRDLAGAVVITASHNPPTDNGIKFIPSDGAPAMPEVMDAIEARLATPDPLPEAKHGTVRMVDVQERHATQCLELVEELVRTDSPVDDASATAPEDADIPRSESESGRLAGLTVAYDAMYGSGRDVTDALLERAGATVRRLHCTQDPTFGGSAPEPKPETLERLIEMVTAGEADLGIANDGDADRLAVVTPNRGYLDENWFFAALYDFLLERAQGPAVRTVSTTYLIDRVGKAHDQVVHEVPVGFKWVASAMAEHDALVGGEESGGFTVRGHVREKDGVFLALLASVMHAAEPLDSRIDRLLETHGAIVQDKTSVECPDAEKERVLNALESTIPETVAGTPVADVNPADGFKLLLEDGSWLLVRPSGTEPVLRIYAEAETDDRVDTLLVAGTKLLDQHL